MASSDDPTVYISTITRISTPLTSLQSFLNVLQLQTVEPNIGQERYGILLSIQCAVMKHLPRRTKLSGYILHNLGTVLPRNLFGIWRRGWLSVALYDSGYLRILRGGI
jgi:hypothetical protein